jgi:hypothetical protein
MKAKEKEREREKENEGRKSEMKKLFVGMSPIIHNGSRK